MNSVKVYLLDKDDNAQYGLNWGQRQNRDPNQAYLQLSPDVYHTDFFPPKGKYFIVDTDDNKTIIMTRAQKKIGTALEVPENNAFLGEYLRERLNIGSGNEITKDDIINSGITELTFIKKDDMHYSLYFGNYEENVQQKSESTKVNLTPIILYGPPGTGKTHDLKKKYINNFDKENYWFTTFHQSFSYEEFVEGLKPILDENREDVAYRIEKGVFYKACEKAAQLAGYSGLKDCIGDSEENRIAKFKEAIDNQKLVLLCIDEINRGNVAAIFGDLISLIEPSKRLGAEHELILTLPYSKERFGVPANLLIVGTMNTADRSIQLLDSALRRRFEFQEYLPNDSIIENIKAREILISINARVRALINKDSQIGHSYFFDIPKSEDTEEEARLILKAMVNKIIPLLEEYFYNDHTKIRFVLSEDDKTENPFYIKDAEATKAYAEFEKIAEFEEKMDLYKLNPKVKEALDVEQKAKAFLDRWN